MIGKLLVVSDESGRHGDRQTADLIKTWITSSEVVTEQKMQPSVSMRNATDFVFLSNNSDAVYLSSEDRRFGIFEVTSPRLPDQFYCDFVAWRDAPAGLPALMHYLQTIDLTGFDAKGHAPMTNAKQSMIDASRNGTEQFLAQAFVAGTVSDQYGRDLFSSAELTRAYEYSTGQRTTAEVMGRALSSYGAPNRRVRVGGGQQPVLYALDNTAHWLAQSGPDWAAEMVKQTRLPRLL
jgi:hypothetical protein